jgi:hypothetical protein
MSLPELTFRRVVRHEPDPCAECKGKCCRDVYTGYRHAHADADIHMHDCEACFDGTVPVLVHTAEDERADMLAYLAYARAFPFTYATSTADVIDALRELVAQGQHVGWAKKGEP